MHRMEQNTPKMGVHNTHKNLCNGTENRLCNPQDTAQFAFDAVIKRIHDKVPRRKGFFKAMPSQKELLSSHTPRTHRPIEE
eukprot:3441815-Pleurochrysis_carterae.AAC.1